MRTPKTSRGWSDRCFCVRDSFFRGREFATFTQMQAEASQWSLQTAGRRACRPLGGAAPHSLFLAVERDTLLPPPTRPFELATWHTPKVAPDAHVMVGGARYSVPFALIGRRLDARLTETTLTCFLDGELMKTHSRVRKGGRLTDWADYPPEKVAFLMRTPVWCRKRSAELGPAVAELIGELLGVQALHRLRAAQGVIALAERYDPERLDAACAGALYAGDPSLRTVRGILRNGREALVLAEPAALPEAPAHLHGCDTLFAYLEV